MCAPCPHEARSKAVARVAHEGARTHHLSAHPWGALRGGALQHFAEVASQRRATQARADLPPSLDLVTLAGYHLAAHGTSRTRHSRTPVHARQPPLQECHSGDTPVAALTPCAAHRRRVGGYAPGHVAPHVLPSLASKSGNASTSGPASELGPRDFCGLPPCSTRHTTHAAQPRTRA